MIFYANKKAGRKTDAEKSGGAIPQDEGSGMGLSGGHRCRDDSALHDLGAHGCRQTASVGRRCHWTGGWLCDGGSCGNGLCQSIRPERLLSGNGMCSDSGCRLSAVCVGNRSAAGFLGADSFVFDAAVRVYLWKYRCQSSLSEGMKKQGDVFALFFYAILLVLRL